MLGRRIELGGRVDHPGGSSAPPTPACSTRSSSPNSPRGSRLAARQDPARRRRQHLEAVLGVGDPVRAFSGACPRWNVFSAVLTPGMIRIQMSQMPDGTPYFCIARTIQKDSGGYHAQQPVQSIGLGSRLEFAHQLIYSDSVNLDSRDALVPVGVTCRMCERTDCERRAVPSLKVPLHIDENQRGISLYTAVER
ncbi:MAG TPA: short-chain fatty acyl-CoA regulator family protein [Kofleriaceae bacterium]